MRLDRGTAVAGAGFVVVLAVGAGFWLVGGSDTPRTVAAVPTTSAASRGGVVGTDLHSLTVSGGQMYVGGHGGVAVSADGGRLWSAVPSLADADAMGWAISKGRMLIGGHPGLKVSTDGGLTFKPLTGPSGVTDVHALGGANSRVYLASPTGGLFASADAGRTWTSRNDRVGATFMGTMLVDPANPDHVVAPDMRTGAVVTTDGGLNWRSLGGPQGTMSVAWDPKNVDHIVVAGADGASVTRNGGRTWSDIELPAGATVVALSDGGRTLHAAAHVGERARVFTSRDGARTWNMM